MADESITDRELRERVQWLIRLRWIACAGVAVSLIVARILRLPFSLVPEAMFFQLLLLGVLALSNTAYREVANRLAGRSATAKSWQRLAYSQIGSDLTILTFQIHFAGGLENTFKLFYVFHVILAGILLPPICPYLFAGFGSALYTVMVVGEAAGLFEHYPLLYSVSEDYYRSPVVIVSKLFGLAGALFFTSYFATSIMHRLREREKDLSDMAHRLADRTQRLQEAKQALERAGEERTRFLRMVEHELRTPLAAINSCLRTVLAGYAGVLNETARDMISRATTRTTGMLELLQDLLALTKTEHLAEQPATERVDVQSLLKDEVAMQKPLAERKRLAVNLWLGETAPVKGAPDMVQRVFANLVSNAIRYTPSGGEIRIKCETQGDRVVVTVQDTGIGISRDEQARLFQEFFRSPRARNIVPDGTGLGLAFVKRVVDSMGGRIEVAGELDRGTTFTVILPTAP